MTVGYIRILKRDHPRANHMGYVLEHILVAESILGRSLIPGEVIHHINECKDDNRPENLYLFKNQSEHWRYHYHCGRGIPLITESNLADLASS